MTIVWFTLLTLAVFFLMEGVAWTTHRYIMHGPLGWGWHRDHHEPHDKTFEVNDLYGVVGAVVGTSLFVVAWLTDLWWVRAMACGLPVISTDATAGPDLLDDRTGRVIPADDLEALVEVLRWAGNHRDGIARMRDDARRAAERMTWERYRTCVREATAPLVLGGKS